MDDINKMMEEFFELNKLMRKITKDLIDSKDNYFKEVRQEANNIIKDGNHYIIIWKGNW